jgi:xylitol oxidase
MITHHVRIGAQDDVAAGRRNWAGNYAYGAASLHVPDTVADVQRIVKESRFVKALGTRHSFNAIADSTGVQISLERLRELELNERTRTVAVGAGVSYGALSTYLHARGYALHNLASLPHISVAGACATATHGSGCKNGNLATAMSAIELVTAKGDVVSVSRARDAERFAAMVVGLGGLGVVTKVTLDVEPSFAMSQVVYQNLPLRHLEDHFDAIFSSGYSVSLFTDWQEGRATQVWVKSRIDGGATASTPLTFFDATAATANVHPIAGVSAENCTEQMGVPGPWYERLPHFRMNFAPSCGAEMQSEYFVPRRHAFEVIVAVEALKDLVTPHLLISELRTVAADNLWMSPCYSRPSLAIHFTWKPNWPAVNELLPILEERLKPFGARPHWAKLFTMSGSGLRSLYERLPNYASMLEEYDPLGKFRNEFLDKNIFAP